MKHIKAFTVILIVFLYLYPELLFAQEADKSVFYKPREVSRKVRDIESLNLIKGLSLSNEQMIALLPHLYESRLQEIEVLEGYKKDGSHAMDMLNMLEGRIMEGQGIDVPVEEKVWFALGTLYEYEYDQYIAEGELIDQVKEILNDNQRRILGEYMPCVIPWDHLDKPERIGQSGSIDKLEKILDMLRTKKGEEYKEEKRNYLIELDWRMRIDRHEEDETRQILIRQIDTKIDVIMKIPDEDYQIRKTELAQSIRPPDLEILPPRVGEELNKYILRYILNPHNIPYIQYQLDKEGVDYPKPDDIIDEDIDKEVD